MDDALEISVYHEDGFALRAGVSRIDRTADGLDVYIRTGILHEARVARLSLGLVRVLASTLENVWP